MCHGGALSLAMLHNRSKNAQKTKECSCIANVVPLTQKPADAANHLARFLLTRLPWYTKLSGPAGAVAEASAYLS